MLKKMSSRMKEDEKNEKIIRSLLKLPANKRCINCNSLGPQYVCTSFWTFVCTNCCGIHREFSHRVKSVSMAKFSPQEVSALHGGGNERAREIYFKELDLQRHHLPDSSNVERLRDFIKHVYVDRRYTGERSIGRIQRVKSEREDTAKDRRLDAYQGGSWSPQYVDAYQRSYHDHSVARGRMNDGSFRFEERRSPIFGPEIRRIGSHRRTARFEVVDDRVRDRDDRAQNGNQNKRSEDCRFSEGAAKPDRESSNHRKELNTPSSPVVRPVQDILGEDAPLQITDSPNENGSISGDGSAKTQRTESSGTLASTDGNSVAMKRINSGNLIDFSEDPGPLVTAAPSDPFSGQIVQQPTTSSSVNGGEWPSFGFTAQEKPSHPPTNASALESALSQLSAPETVPVCTMLTLPIAGVGSIKPTGGEKSPATQQQQQPSFLAAVDSHSVQSVTPRQVGSANNQQGNSFIASIPQGLLTVAPVQPSQVAQKVLHTTGAGISSQPLPAEAKTSGRNELPEDLFTSPAPAPFLGWQAAPPHGMGFGMQYPPTAMLSIPAFPQPSKSTNPFDINSESTPIQAPAFPSMVSLQGALPNVSAPLPVLDASSFSTPGLGWVLPQLYSSPSAMPPSPYMMQQLPTSVSPMGHQSIGGFGREGAAFGTSGVDQQSVARYPRSTTPNSFSSCGGNPFG